MSGDQLGGLEPMEPGQDIGAVDVGRAARIGLASRNRDAHGLNLVIAEAVADPDGSGVLRLLVALAGQAGFMGELLSPPDDPDAYLTGVVAVALHRS